MSVLLRLFLKPINGVNVSTVQDVAPKRFVSTL